MKIKVVFFIRHSPVVPPVSEGSDGNEQGLRCPGFGIVGVIPEHVCGRVHEPREVKHQAVPERPGHPESPPEVFLPRVRGHETWQYEAHEEGEPGVQALLKHHHRIRFEVCVAERAACRDDVGALLEVEPAHVGKEEAALDVVRVRVGFRVSGVWGRRGRRGDRQRRGVRT